MLLGLALGASLGLAPACWVEIEAPEVCVLDVPLDYAPGLPTAITRPITGDELLAAIPGGASANLELLGLELAADRGVTDLGFLERVRVRAEPAEPLASGALGAVELIDATRPPDHPPAEPWFIEAATRANLIELLEGPALLLSIELLGTMPERPFGLATELCFAARGSYRF